jgi:cytoskeleton protein RodZ
MSDVQQVDPALASAGTLLRQAREAAGLHVAALAVAMKVPVKKLEALESDRMDLLPDAVFVRALASSVCRALKIDAAPILAKLPQNAVPRLDSEYRGINAPFHTPGENRGSSALALLGRPTVVLVAMLLVAAVVLVFLPDSGITADTTETPAPSQPAQALQVPVNPVVSVEPVLAASNPASSSAVVPSVLPAVASPVSQSDPVKPAPVAVVPPEKGLTTAAEVLSKGDGPAVVGFRVRGPSWVEVTDAKGVVQLRKTMALGEYVNASGVLPLSVVIGRADVTDVEVRGKAFSLNGLAKDNVARFEVK